ncbi:MAG: hypothetical protein IPJ03_02065 [Ignavibacteriales bacterium]|nr:hypothetical protein [Ignavibacteriales bacterium]
MINNGLPFLKILPLLNDYPFFSKEPTVGTFSIIIWPGCVPQSGTIQQVQKLLTFLSFDKLLPLASFTHPLHSIS